MKTNNENGPNSSENTHKVLIDPTIPIEELLGSVTTYNNVDGSESFQLRTSARVFKKMKLDSALAALPDKKETEKKEEPPPKPEVKKPGQKPFWTSEERNYFFEALNEYGKDFEAIHNYIIMKLRRKGTPEHHLKTRDQVRHNYYRTWNKISKYLKFSEDVKKVVQELYALINFGELRKKFASIGPKTCKKLNELIYRGTLSIRVKGKTIRVRTPMCKALRRLNRLEENDDSDIKLPTRVLVECMPKDMYTWMKVQEMSQNPRIRILVPLQRRLNSLIYYLSQRWQNHESLEHEKLILANEASGAQSNDELLFPTKIEPLHLPPLRLAPSRDVTVVLPTFNITEFFTTQSICLNAYEERIGAKQSGEMLWLEAFSKQVKNGSKKGIKRPRTESSSEKNAAGKSTAPTVTDSNENCVPETETVSDKVTDSIDEAVNTILSLQQVDKNEDIDVSMKKSELAENEDVLNDDSLSLVKQEHDIANIRLGWTGPDCGTLTVGDLYLMFGQDSKIQIEYSWDEVFPPAEIKKEEITFGEDVKIEQEIVEETSNITPNTRPNVTSTLKQLLSVAKLHYRKNMVKCPCGHVCGSPTKNNSKGKTKNMCNDNKNVMEMSTQPNTIVTVLQPNIVTTTANMVPILIQPEIKKFSPQSLFRRPNLPSYNYRDQLNPHQMMPRYCNRKGRPRAKHVVVERKLPILANKADNTRVVQVNQHPQETIAQPGQGMPIVLASVPHTNTSATQQVITPTATERTFQIVPMEQTEIVIQPQTGLQSDIVDNATSLSRVGSPTSISNLLDMALKDANGSSTEKGDGITNFVGLLSDGVSETPPCSPSRLLKENDDQWINAEVQDFSFSSFLGHLDSPIKTAQPVNHLNVNSEDTRMSLTHDVDAQLQSLLTETSLDYTAKFADLAAQVADYKK